VLLNHKPLRYFTATCILIQSSLFVRSGVVANLELGGTLGGLLWGLEAEPLVGVSPIEAESFFGRGHFSPHLKISKTTHILSDVRLIGHSDSH